MGRKQAVAAVGLAAVLTMSACTAAGPGSGSPPTTVAPMTSTVATTPITGRPAVTVASLLPEAPAPELAGPALLALVPGIRQENHTENSPAMALSVSHPVLPGSGAGVRAVNAVLADWVAAETDRFRAALGAPTVRGNVELNISWRLTAVTGTTVAVAFSEYFFPGGAASTLGTTFYLDARTGLAVRGSDLFTADGASEVGRAVVELLRRSGRVPDAEALRSADWRPRLLDGLELSAAGLQLVVPQGLLLSRAQGSPRVSLPDSVHAYLTPTGRAFVAAAADPSPWVAPVPPQATTVVTTRPGSTARPSTARPSTARPSTARPSTARPSTTAPPVIGAPSVVPEPAPTTGRGSTPGRASTTGPSPAAPRRPDCAVLRCIALTFDDGPGPYTDALVRELVRAKAPATFFLLGQQAALYPDQVRRLAAAGMTIGNHTQDHRNLINMSPADQRAEVAGAAAVIRPLVGHEPQLLRPPYGSSDADTLRLGLPLVLWDVDTEDWKNRNAATTTARALAGSAPGSIVLMHDIHPSTVTAVPGIIAALRHRGYTLVSVPELIGTPMVAGHRYFSRHDVR